MTTKERTDAELWEALGDLSVDFLASDLPEAVVDAELRELGLEPGVLRQDGARLCAEYQEEKRLAWRKTATKRKEDLAARAARAAATWVGETKDELLARLEALRLDPVLGEPVRVAFRKRRPEESSEAELRMLLEDVEALREIAGDGTKKRER